MKMTKIIKHKLDRSFENKKYRSKCLIEEKTTFRFKILNFNVLMQYYEILIDTQEVISEEGDLISKGRQSISA